MNKEMRKEEGKSGKMNEEDLPLPPKPTQEYHAAYRDTGTKSSSLYALDQQIAHNLKELEELESEIKKPKKGLFSHLFKKKESAAPVNVPRPEVRNPTRDFLAAVKEKAVLSKQEVLFGDEAHKKGMGHQREYEEYSHKKERQLLEKEHQLKQDTAALDHEQRAIIKKIAQLEKSQKDLDARESEFLATLEKVEAEKRDLDRKLKDELKEAQQQKFQFQRSLEKVNVYEKKITEKEEALALKEEELKLYEQDTKATKAQIDREEANIVAKYNDIKQTKEMLEKEQDALLREIARLEHDQKLLNSKENEVLDLVAKLEEQKRMHEQRKLELDAREQDIVEQEQESKKKRAIVQRELSHLKMLQEKGKELEKMEAMYERLKKRLTHGYGQLEKKFRHEHGLDQRQESLQQKASSPQPEAGTGTAVKTNVFEQQGTMISDEQIASLLNVVKELIAQGNFERAKSQIQSLFDRCQVLDGDRKRELYYTLRSLENELKLKELTI